jgi:hypothetical protein
MDYSVAAFAQPEKSWNDAIELAKKLEHYLTFIRHLFCTLRLKILTISGHFRE